MVITLKPIFSQNYYGEVIEFSTLEHIIESSLQKGAASAGSIYGSINSFLQA